MINKLLRSIIELARLSLLVLISPTTAISLVDRARIQDTIAKYAIYVDTKQFSRLDECLSAKIWADYGPHLGSFTNVAELQKALKNVFKNVKTHHAQSTQLIRNESAQIHAVTFFTSSQFSAGGTAKQAVYLYGRYEDVLEKVVSYDSHGLWDHVCGTVDSEPVWRIVNRTMMLMGPEVGDLSIFES